MVKEIMKEIGNKSREFYEFVLPPVDMHLENNHLIVTIDIPGFNKDDIRLTIHGNILSINAEKKEDSLKKDEVICNQRPTRLDKKIRLPLRTKSGEEKVDSAKYLDGVLTITIPIETGGKKISIE
jgi:HSP20 family molecular chaperone IbpA